MLKKRLASDREKALKILQEYSGNPSIKSKEVVNFDEYNRIFCKGIFKDALVNISSQFDKMKSSEELSLTIKINEYQRNQMFNGLDH